MSRGVIDDTHHDEPAAKLDPDVAATAVQLQERFNEHFANRGAQT